LAPHPPTARLAFLNTYYIVMDVLDLLEELEAEFEGESKERRDSTSSPTSVYDELSVNVSRKGSVKPPDVELSWGSNLIYQQMSARGPAVPSYLPATQRATLSPRTLENIKGAAAGPSRPSLSTLPASAANQAVSAQRAPATQAAPAQKAPASREVDASDWFEQRRLQRAKQQAATAARERMTERGFSSDLVDSYLQHVEEALQRLVAASV